MYFRGWLQHQVVRAGGADILADLVNVEARTINRWLDGSDLPTALHVAALAEVCQTPKAQLVLAVNAAREVQARLRAVRKPLARVEASVPESVGRTDCA